MPIKATGIRWHLAVPPEVSTEYVGTKLGDYYSRADIMLRTQLEARECFRSLYGVDIGGPHVAVPAYVGVAALGAELVLPYDHAPMVANQGRVLPNEHSVLALEPAEPEASIWLQEYLSIREKLAQSLGYYPNMGAGQEGPITSAVLLRGSHFYVDLLDNPVAAHHLLAVVTETYIRFVRYIRRVNGRAEQDGVGIADDMAGMISPAMWPEFVIPYWERIYRELGPGPRSVHTELLRRDHLRYLKEMDIASYDPGNDQYLTVHDVVAELGDMDFSWNLYTVRDMLEGTPESIKALYTEAVAAGARHIMTELCRGTARKNVHAFVAVARQYE
ncbi:MAG: uroporphyrinogen decarboxylase family protein [Anaerolineae bacterium]